MKKVILIIGAIATLVLAILWYFNKVSEPLFSVGTGVLTVLGYIFVPDEKKHNTKIKQKHSGTGDNVAGNKTINN
jgi:hypothetical protein